MIIRWVLGIDAAGAAAMVALLAGTWAQTARSRHHRPR